MCAAAVVAAGQIDTAGATEGDVKRQCNGVDGKEVSYNTSFLSAAETSNP